jgi:hypothetical protein
MISAYPSGARGALTGGRKKEESYATSIK